LDIVTWAKLSHGSNPAPNAPTEINVPTHGEDGPTLHDRHTPPLNADFVANAIRPCPKRVGSVARDPRS
jgi:hypothetical protein